ncbi:MAG: hypothetical protein AAGD11_02965 [Planctomycetota bacterium]
MSIVRTALEVAVGQGFVDRTRQQNFDEEQDDVTEHMHAGEAATKKGGSAANAVTTFPEVRQPIERDDEEARQLLRLSQLEGRDPLQDAVAGRLALDRLDAIADGCADSHHANWADEMRRELRERFNEIAPTKFSVKTDN